MGAKPRIKQPTFDVLRLLDACTAGEEAWRKHSTMRNAWKANTNGRWLVWLAWKLRDHNAELNWAAYDAACLPCKKDYLNSDWVGFKCVGCCDAIRKAAPWHLWRDALLKAHAILAP
jgi:hypothetical protein